MISRTNRKGQTYYLHQGVTKSGKPRWYTSTDAAGELAAEMPEGYEFYERPENAQVFFRKIPRTAITDAELNLVRQLACSKARTRYTIVDAESKAIILYAADSDDVDARVELMSSFGANSAKICQFMERHQHYDPVLRFKLIDAQSRVFYAERWCFRGSIDDWFPLAHGPLEKLANEFIPHVGAESFFELM
jgi:hypothetical protein